MSKVTIDDVRRALWEAYSEATQHPDYCGKSNEAEIEVHYPNFWAAQTAEDFMEPDGLTVYSYALGPSRSHYFIKARRDRQPNYYTWESPDPFAKAVEVINQWRDEHRRLGVDE